MYDQGLVDSQTGVSNRQDNLEKEVKQLKNKIEEIEKTLKSFNRFQKKLNEKTNKK